MLAIIQLSCAVCYFFILCGLAAGCFFGGRIQSREKRVCLRRAERAEKEIFDARRRLKKNERLVLCVPSEKSRDRELCYIVAHIQRRDPASRILWVQEKGARAG